MAVMFYQMFTVRGLTWYCGGTPWTATFSKQRVCEKFGERLVQYDLYLVLHEPVYACFVVP